MNIDNLTDQEKSVMLARAMGLSEPRYLSSSQVWIIENNNRPNLSVYVSPKKFDLYDPANMALAWWVLNWAYAQKHWYKKHLGLMGDVLYDKFWSDDTFFELSPTDAQRLWIDQILSLAIEAGIVKV